MKVQPGSLLSTSLLCLWALPWVAACTDGDSAAHNTTQIAMMDPAAANAALDRRSDASSAHSASNAAAPASDTIAQVEASGTAGTGMAGTMGAGEDATATAGDPAAGNPSMAEATAADMMTEPANYDLVFADDRVHSIHIKMTAAQHQLMQDNLKEITSGAGGGFPDIAALGDACAGLNDGEPCESGSTKGTCRTVPFLNTKICSAGESMPADGAMPTMPAGGGGALELLSGDPIEVDVQVKYGEQAWEHVGMRYKGNSSLAGSSRMGILKVSFRLDFDEFEEMYPETKNQKFHGFKDMTFSSNYSDPSMLRDTLVTEVLRERGIPAARCAFYRVFVDTGAGEVYWGLYTAIEDPSDGPMFDAQFGSSDGNIYKPSGVGADWSVFAEEGFEKKNNKKEADFSDVQAAISALNAGMSDPAAWRSELERYVDVDHFLRWLAINTVVENWDSYGRMAHNYYLYGDPGDNGRLKWIPWDHNLSMRTESSGFSFGGFGAGNDFFHAQVPERWPLIKRLLADPVYMETYRAELVRALEGAFSIAAMDQRMHELHALIAPYVVGPMGENVPYSTLSSPESFEQSIDGSGQLLDHVRSRHMLTANALQ